MTPNHTVITRPATPEELAEIEPGSGEYVANFGCLGLLFVLGPSVLCALLAGWLVGGIWAGWIGAGAGAFLGLWASWSMSREITASIRADHQRRRADISAGTVQVLEVQDPRVSELFPDGLALDIGGGKLLILTTQRFFDAELYEAPRPDNDDGDDFYNGLPPPHSFPSTRFTMHRFPESGRVLQIRVTGDYVAPSESPIEDWRAYDLRESDLLEGSIDLLQEALAPRRGPI